MLEEMSTSTRTTGLVRLSERVQRICEEADAVASMGQQAKSDLVFTQRWLCAKAGVKTNEWLHGWAQFFDQIAAAFGRAHPRASPPADSVANLAPPAGATSARAASIERTPLVGYGVRAQQIVSGPVCGGRLPGTGIAYKENVAPPPSPTQTPPTRAPRALPVAEKVAVSAPLRSHPPNRAVCAPTVRLDDEARAEDLLKLVREHRQVCVSGPRHGGA